MHDITVLTQMAFILAAAFSGGLLLQRLKQPAMVGYIIVGIIFGPHGLGLIHDGEEIHLLSELGILLLLFIVGLELDLHNFASVYKIAIGTTLLQILFAFLAMTGLGTVFNWPLEMIIVLSFAVSLSSTAVAIKLLEDMKALNTPVGNVAIGILIAQDLAVIPMILIISALGSSEGSLLEHMILPVILVFATALLILTLLKRPAWLSRLDPLMNRVKAAMDRDRQRPLTALMLCFAAAAVCGGLGFSAAYGAFMAGILLGNSRYGHQYERQIRPLFDILMMFFFLSVGMLIDFQYLTDNIVTVMALLLVVMCLKTFINIGVLHVLGLSNRHATFVGATLGQVGEFSFALAALGLAQGAIQDDVYKMIVLVVALSLIATPMWLHFMRRFRIFYRFRPLRPRKRVAAPRAKASEGI